MCVTVSLAMMLSSAFFLSHCGFKELSPLSYRASGSHKKIVEYMCRCDVVLNY
jgi:hypothetical protein